MASIATAGGPALINPLDRIEEMVSANDWPFDRANEQELMVGINGGWCPYQLWFGWRDDPGVLQFYCGFDMKVPEAKQSNVCALLARINEAIWMGHFAVNFADGTVMFRHAQVLFPDAAAAPYETLIDLALTECERYYPAFQFVIWGGKPAAEAIAAALLDTQGEA